MPLCRVCDNQTSGDCLHERQCLLQEASSCTKSRMPCRDNAIPLVTSHIPSLSLEGKREALQAAVNHILTEGTLHMVFMTDINCHMHQCLPSALAGCVQVHIYLYIFTCTPCAVGLRCGGQVGTLNSLHCRLTLSLCHTAHNSAVQASPQCAIWGPLAKQKKYGTLWSRYT